MKLTADNYHSIEANQMYMSSSQFRDFLRCQAMAKARIRGDWVVEPSTAMLVGSYVDAHFTGDLELFKEENPEIFKRDGEPKAGFRHAEVIIERIEREPVLLNYLHGEHQTIMTGQIGSVPFRVKLDVLNKDWIADLKIMRDFRKVWSDWDHEYQNWIDAWGYNFQAAIYQEIVRQNTGSRLPLHIVAATKESTPDVALLNIMQDELDRRLQDVIHMAPVFQAVKMGLHLPERCEACDYCKQTKKITSPKPYKEELL